MNSKSWAIVALFLWAISSQQAFAADDPYPPLERHAFEQEGIGREFFVHVPDSAEGPMPVVLAIHGYTSTATGFAVFHDLMQHADDHGYIVVFPQGSHFVDENDAGPYRVTSWNLLGDAESDPGAGPQCLPDADSYPCPPECGACDRCTWASCHDDLAYFDRLLDILGAEYATDLDRYYALGMSNGGMMTLRLGCDRADRFAAIAPIDAQLPAGFSCGPGRSLPMIHFSGGKDDVVRADGKPSSDGFFYVSADETAARWADDLQCEAGPVDWSTDDTVAAGLECRAYRDCAAAGQPVILCQDPDETHNWPGRRPGGAWPTCVTSQQKEAMPEQRLCEPRQETGPHLGMDVIWAFFEQYERQGD